MVVVGLPDASCPILVRSAVRPVFQDCPPSQPTLAPTSSWASPAASRSSTPVRAVDSWWRRLGWAVQACGSGALCTDWRQCSAARQRCAPYFAQTPSSPSSSSCPFSPAGHGTQIEWDSLSDSAATVPVSCKRLDERDERVLLDPCMCNRPALLQLHCCAQRRVVEATHRATRLRQPSNRRTAVVEHPPLLCSAQPAAPLQGHLTCRPLPLLPLLPARSPQVVDDKWHAIFDGSAEGKTVRQVPGERGAGQHWGGGSRRWFPGGDGGRVGRPCVLALVRVALADHSQGLTPPDALHPLLYRPQSSRCSSTCTPPASTW